MGNINEAVFYAANILSLLLTTALLNIIPFVMAVNVFIVRTTPLIQSTNYRLNGKLVVINIDRVVFVYRLIGVDLRDANELLL